MRHKFKNAQITLEYLSIAVLVGLGVLIMGSYVVKAINAYFKTTDDTLEDSFLEEQLPHQNDLGPGCVCAPSLNNGCAAGDCEAWQVEMVPQCNPPGCAGGPYCVTDRETCCSPRDIGCRMHGCLNGYMAVDVSCVGFEPPLYTCDFRAACKLECSQDKPDYFSQWCDLGGVEPAGYAPASMTTSHVTTYVYPGECDGITYCQAECSAPYMPQDKDAIAGNEFCGCPPDTIEEFNPPIPPICKGDCVRDQWVQKTDPNISCDATCANASAGSTLTATAEGWTCASGNNPIPGIPQGWYTHQTDASVPIGPGPYYSVQCSTLGTHCVDGLPTPIATFTSWTEGPIDTPPLKCYRSLQPMDGLGSDIAIACYCKDFTYCCCKDAAVTAGTCPPVILPETECGHYTGPVPCAGGTYCGGSLEGYCASLLVWNMIDTNCKN